MSASHPVRKFFMRPVVWVVFVLIFIASLIFSLANFKKAFSIISLDVRMDRALALQDASNLAAQFHIGPATYRKSVSFDFNRKIRNFIELEGGGKEAFRSMIMRGDFYPYQWQVRHFNEHQQHEATFYFAPDGKPIGFSETLPDNLPVRVLSREAAEALLQRVASQDWNVVFSDYTLQDYSSQVAPNGRVEHQFIYEKNHQDYGRGRIRLVAVVDGDHLAFIRPIFSIPRSFFDHYRALQDTNRVISLFGNFAFVSVYLLGGGIAAIVYLIRRRLVLWKKPMVVAFLISGLHALSDLNELPLRWMDYDTALTLGGFYLKNFIEIGRDFILWFAVVSVSIIAAEGLSRRAFAKRIQFWQVWTTELASSMAVWGRTIGGHLVVGLNLAFVVAFYRVATEKLGWWIPTESLYSPNILATQFSWFSPIARSLLSAFWEECLFRAVPLALASLIGEKLKLRKTFIFSALILQAVVFGACHANYPGYPPFARVVELFLPSIGFGLLYLSFGLLPTIVAHFTYNVVLLSLPLFVSQAPGIWVERFLLIFFACSPLWYVMVARLYHGKWHELTDSMLNQAWKPSKKIIERTLRPLQPISRLSGWTISGIKAFGIFGLIAWLYLTPFQSQVPPTDINREQAVKAARVALLNQGVDPAAQFRVLTTHKQGPNLAEEFTWKENGSELYQKLMGTYLPGPNWLVRFVAISPSENTPLEYQYFIGQKGRVLRYRTILPDSFKPTPMVLDDVRMLSVRAATQFSGRSEEDLQEILTRSYRRGRGQEWLMVYRDNKVELRSGEAQVVIRIAGDQIIEKKRVVYVPRLWARMHKYSQDINSSISNFATILTYLIVLLGFGFSLYRWTHKHFNYKAFFVFFVLILSLKTALIVNMWPYWKTLFLPGEPLWRQISFHLGIQWLWGLLWAAILSVIAGFIHFSPFQKVTLSKSIRFLVNVALAFGIAGILSLPYFLDRHPLVWPNLAFLQSHIPVFSLIGDQFLLYIEQTLIVLVVLLCLDRLNRLFHWHRYVRSTILLIVGVIFSLSMDFSTLSIGLLTAFLTGVAFVIANKLLLKHHMAFVPLLMAVLHALDCLQKGVLEPVPQAFKLYAFAAILILVFSWAWYVRLIDEKVPSAE